MPPDSASVKTSLRRAFGLGVWLQSGELDTRAFVGRHCLITWWRAPHRVSGPRARIPHSFKLPVNSTDAMCHRRVPLSQSTPTLFSARGPPILGGFVNAWRVYKEP